MTDVLVVIKKRKDLAVNKTKKLNIYDMMR
jgi:hypothetical protein